MIHFLINLNCLSPFSRMFYMLELKECSKEMFCSDFKRIQTEYSAPPSIEVIGRCLVTDVCMIKISVYYIYGGYACNVLFVRCMYSCSVNEELCVCLHAHM